MTSKTKLDDVTFLIAIRIDSITRLENLLLVVDFLLTHFTTHIHILEAAPYNNHLLGQLLPKEVTLRFVEDYDPVFYRTKYNNLLVKNCQTPLLAVWDADVIAPPEQIEQSVKCLRNKKEDIVFPYKNICLDTSHIIRELYLKTRDLELLTKNTGKMPKLYTFSFGGGFFANRSRYIESGMDNEQFYGWGRQDGERVNRWKILGYRYKSVPGLLFHFTHERGLNSAFHTEEQRDIKHSKILRIHGMSKHELEKEVKTWKH